MKNIRRLILNSLSFVVLLVAATEVSTASLWGFYQPKAPKELQK